MSITTDINSAQAMTGVFDDVAARREVKIRDIINVLDENEGYKIWVAKLGGEEFKEEYLNLWQGILTNEEYKGKLDMIHQKYGKILENIGVLKSNLEFARNIDPSLPEKLVLKYLPEATKIDVKIYFLVDGYNSGTVIDRQTYTQCIWALDPQYFFNFGIYALAHELHHIGFFYWQNRELERQAILRDSNCNSLAVKLVGSVLGEGSAVYYIDKQIHKETWEEVLSRLMGEDVFREYDGAEQNAKTKVVLRIKEFEELMFKLLEGASNYEVREEEVRKYSFMQGMEPALDKLIGEEMVGCIDKALGKDKLFECIKNLQKFLPAYNEAAEKLKKVKLSEKLLAQWECLWKNR